MASLYSRATPQQARILRMIEGAIVNAAHAHPEIRISPRHRRSIAKRATGTLSSQWPEVLAATRRSDGANASAKPSQGRKGQVTSLSPRALIRLSMERVARHTYVMPSEAGAVTCKPLPLLDLGEKCLQACARPIRMRGDLELYEAVTGVLRILGRRRKERAP